ncbi:MAG: hypothetical protein HUU55_15620 [Myxococcales bacterium]|nr:hypothetical protein [Myxococcales bacterium]
MSKKYLYFPTRIFDDMLLAFAQLYVSKNWSFTGVDPAQLEADAIAQRQQRAELDAITLAYIQKKADFDQKQFERYKRFAQALNAARGAFRHDRVTIAELAKFKLKPTKRPTSVPSDSVATSA